MRWPFCEFQKQDAKVRPQTYQEILSACIITTSLIHEATTLIEKLFKLWERHLSVQIAYLIEKGF